MAHLGVTYTSKYVVCTLRLYLLPNAEHYVDIYRHYRGHPTVRRGGGVFGFLRGTSAVQRWNVPE